MGKKHIIVGLIICILVLICSWLSTPKSIAEKDYLHKIWVNEDCQFNGFLFSFYINHIKENFITGYLHIGEPAMPDLYVYREEPSKYLIPFSGEIKGNVAVCSLDTKLSQTGTLTIQFLGNGALEASLLCTNAVVMKGNMPSTSYLSFRPYHLSDIEIVAPEKEIVVETELNSWGHVYIKAEQGSRAPIVLITDQYGNILYSFWNTITGTEVAQVVVEDLNSDGLKDIKFLMKPYGATDTDIELWREYYQREDGLFKGQGRQGDGSSVLTDSRRGDEIPTNDEMAK